MYQNKTKKNNSGFAHQALLGVLVVAVISFVGVRLLTLSHAQNIQTANTGSIILPSCGVLKVIVLNGRQITPNDPNIHGKIDAALILKNKYLKRQKIAGYRAVFNIWNSKAVWNDGDKYTGPVFSTISKYAIFFGLKIPIWTAVANPTYNFKLDVYGGSLGSYRKCHSSITGTASAVCDAKTGLWALISKWPTY